MGFSASNGCAIIVHMPNWLQQFFVPRLSSRFLVRALALAGLTFVVGKWVFRPMFVQGASMEPTYARQGFTFGNLLAYRWRTPQRGEVVLLRYGGSQRYLLKRLLAFAGETVEFRKGVCFVNGAPLNEPYVAKPCYWDVPPRTVAHGHVYVMGDNRSVPFESHVGGEIAAARIAGRPLW